MSIGVSRTCPAGIPYHSGGIPHLARLQRARLRPTTPGTSSLSSPNPATSAMDPSRKWAAFVSTAKSVAAKVITPGNARPAFSSSASPARATKRACRWAAGRSLRTDRNHQSVDRKRRRVAGWRRHAGHRDQAALGFHRARPTADPASRPRRMGPHSRRRLHPRASRQRRSETFP